MADKQIKIKTGVCKRVHKELKAYETEYKKQQEKIEKMRADGADEYDIRKQEEVLGETNMMLPDCRSRLQRSVDDLEPILNDSKNSESLDETTISAAEEAIATAVAALAA